MASDIGGGFRDETGRDPDAMINFPFARSTLKLAVVLWGDARAPDFASPRGMTGFGG